VPGTPTAAWDGAGACVPLNSIRVRENTRGTETTMTGCTRIRPKLFCKCNSYPSPDGIHIGAVKGNQAPSFPRHDLPIPRAGHCGEAISRNLVPGLVIATTEIRWFRSQFCNHATLATFVQGHYGSIWAAAVAGITARRMADASSPAPRYSLDEALRTRENSPRPAILLNQQALHWRSRRQTY